MEDILEAMNDESGTTIRTFNILKTNVSENGYEVYLEIDLDSGYELEDVKLNITFDDLAAYETNDIQEAVKYALGFFENRNELQ